jgi:hypothetical protein
MNLERIEAYKPDVARIADRLKSMDGAVASGRTGNIVFRAYMDTDNVYDKIDLTSYDYGNDINRYTDDLLKINKRSFEARKKVSDDVIPFVLPFLGIGDYSAFFDGDVFFAKDTSWSIPTIIEWEDMHKIRPYGKAPFYSILIDIFRHVTDTLKETGIPVNRGFYSPLDLAYALRGQELFTDFFENTSHVHELLGICTKATIDIASDIKKIAADAYVNEKYGEIFFKNRISMSEDTACMISPEQYREFGAPYTQKVIDHFGNGSLHCHSRALYLVKELCSLRNVFDIWIASDPNQPRPIDHLKELINVSNGVCLSADCASFDEIKDHINEMLEGNISLSLPENDVDKINRIVDYVRSRSGI